MVEKAGLVDPPVSLAVQLWLEYIENPTARAWYRAHNKSIVDGYLGNVTKALEERPHEQVFMNEVLYRLLYAEALAEGKEFGKLGAFLANPKLPAVDIMVHLPEFYPDNYPLTKKDIQHALHEAYSFQEIAEKILDEWLILPQLAELYSCVAELLQTPQLSNLVAGGQPAYPDAELYLRASREPWYRRVLRALINLLRSLKKGWLRRGTESE